MQPTTMPTTVNARNVVTAGSRLDKVVVAVAAVAGRRVGGADELPALDVGDHVAVARVFAGRVPRLDQSVRVELVDALQGGHERGPFRLRPRRLQSLHEQTGR